MTARRRTAQSAGWIGAVLLMALTVAVCAQQPRASTGGGAAPRYARIHAIFSDRMFSTFNRSDALAAMKAWFEIVGRERGFEIDSRVDTSSSLAEVRRRLREESVDILILEIKDYLELERTGQLRPELLGNRRSSGEPRYSYVLLAGPASGVQDLPGLRGKTLNCYSRLDSDTCMAWTELALARETLGRAASFFGATRSVSKPQECVLPLFFGRVHACVVDEINFDLLREMNPQLDKLRVLARSAPLVDIVIAVPLKPHPYRQDMMDALRELHQHPRGKQLLMVFKTERLVPIRPGDLDSARVLWAEYDKLTGGYRRQPAP